MICIHAQYSTQLSQLGWDIRLRGRDEQITRVARPVEDDSDSEDLGSDGTEWIDEVLDEYQE